MIPRILRVDVAGSYASSVIQFPPSPPPAVTGRGPTAAIIAARHPDVPMVVNHAGLPTDRDAEGMERWRTGLRLLAAQPQVSMKISGLGITDRAWTTESIRPVVLECIDAFGTERAMFASDFPVEKVHGTFDAFFSAFDAITADFTADERDRLFARNAEAIYRI